MQGQWCGEWGSGDMKRLVWAWDWAWGILAILSLRTPHCVTLDKPICPSGPWFPHLLHDP